MCLFNQKEVDSYDQHLWRNERQRLHASMATLCRKNNIDFTTNLGAVKTSKGCTKIVQMWLGDLLPPIEFWIEKNKECQRLGITIFVFTDNFIEFLDLEYVKFYSDPTLHAVFGVHQGPIEFNHTPSKLYNCFIQRVDSVRQSWLYFLHLKGLLDQGYVSFLLKQLADYSSATGIELFDYIHTKYQLNQLPHFDKAYQELRNQVPYKNFPEIFDLTPYIHDSKYSLVLETYATNLSNNSWLIGEKAIRAICFPTIPVLFMQRRAVEKLKSIGFQIDNHDNVDTMPWIDRQMLLLNIIEHDTIDFNASLLYNRSMHNRDICLKLQQQYQDNTYFDKFLTQVLEH